MIQGCSKKFENKKNLTEYPICVLALNLTVFDSTPLNLYLSSFLLKFEELK